jgi:putative holliday junction resolvase
VGRALGVDLGTRRIGLALTDPDRMVASPLDTFPFASLTKAADALARICSERGADIVVIGFPVREDGSEGEGCGRARVLAGMLGQRGLEAVLWDESWTSRDAEAALRDAGQRVRRSSGAVDRIAASLILRDYLEAQARGVR